MWMRRLCFFANGGDSKAKGIANGLGHALYAAMDLCYRRVLDGGIQDGKLKLDTDDEEVTMSFQDQRKILEQMLLTVARDSPTDAAKRIITFGHKVFNCRRFKNEDYASFAEIFRGVAQPPMNCFRHTPTDDERQQTALITLENAQLPDKLYKNLLSLLVTKHDHREQCTRSTQFTMNAEPLRN